MKTKFYSFVTFLLVFALSALAESNKPLLTEGNSLSDLGNFTIVKAEEPMVVGNETLETYDLIYENASSPVQIGIVQEKKCTTFLVKSGEVEVQYMCKKGTFGARKMAEKYKSAKTNAYGSKLDEGQMKAQQVISKTTSDEVEMLGLIACYFPALVKKQYQSQL